MSLSALSALPKHTSTETLQSRKVKKMAITTNSKIKPSEAGYQNISNLEGDTLTGTVQQNKAQFDAYPNLIKDHYNSLVDDLISEFGSKADAAHAHGAISYNGSIAPISGVDIINGDRFVISRTGSNGVVKASKLSFDGSTTTKYLSPKGEWVDLPEGASVSHSHGWIDKEGHMSTNASAEQVIGNGDSLLIADSSSSGKIVKSKGIYFDGSSTNTVLSKAGLWVPNGNAYITDEVYTNSTGASQSGLMTIYLYSNQNSVIPDFQVYAAYPGRETGTNRYVPLGIYVIYGWYRGTENYYLKIYAWAQNGTAYTLENGGKIIVKHNATSAEWHGISM